MNALAVPTLTFAVHEDGALEVTSAWFPLVAFPVAWIDSADGRRLILRGSELEIRCTNGVATYELGGVNEAAHTRGGRLIRSR